MWCGRGFAAAVAAAAAAAAVVVAVTSGAPPVGAVGTESIPAVTAESAEQPWKERGKKRLSFIIENNYPHECLQTAMRPPRKQK